MIVKFFRHGTGITGGIDYLLNHREVEGTAIVKKGNPHLTKKLIRSIKNKQKYKSGVLSFEEKSISESIKHTIINQFEKVLMPGLDTAQYNILWVEHKDKNRVELHFVIPRLELINQKAINPYYYKIDQKRVDTWKNIINMRYHFTNPNDSNKSQAISGNSHSVEFKTYDQLNAYLENKVKKRSLCSRDEIIAHLKELNFSVTRISDKFISIKLPGMKKPKRFKGSIYSNEFFKKSTNEITSGSFKNENENEKADLIANLKYLQEKKAAYNQKRYPFSRETVEPVKTKKIYRRNINNDSTRNKIIQRIRKTRATQSRTLYENKRAREYHKDSARKSRNSIYERIKNHRAAIYQKQRRARNRTSKFESARREIGSISEKLSEFGTEIEHFIKHLENIQDLTLRDVEIK